MKTKVLNQAVKRNPDRFPEDFMFRLTSEETSRLRSQFVTSKTGRGGRRYSPSQFLILFDAVRRLMAPPAKARPKIGFRR